MIAAGALDYRHVDVFATTAYRGNGLVVVFCDTLDRPAEQLRRITEEMRQFETIFVTTDGDVDIAARIFTVEEELPFAGHPVIGAAAAVHERLASERASVNWRFVIDNRPLRVISERDDRYFTASMDQGRAQSAPPLPESVRDKTARMLGLEPRDATIAFYRELVGLPVVGEFSSSFGEDGTIFGFPDIRVQLEVVRAHETGDPGTFDQLVLYLDDAAAVVGATERLRTAGHAPLTQPHPYWAANGAVIFRDPDGRDVVFAPWVYGRDLDPIDRHATPDG